MQVRVRLGSVAPVLAWNDSGMPEFARAIQHLAHVPKADVDAAIAKGRAEKKSGNWKNR